MRFMSSDCGEPTAASCSLAILEPRAPCAGPMACTSDGSTLSFGYLAYLGRRKVGRRCVDIQSSARRLALLWLSGCTVCLGAVTA